jgi:membrane associated rhomboid family serine protease
MVQYSNPFDELKSFFSRRSMLSALILINTGIWVLTKVAAVFFFLMNNPAAETADNWILGLSALPASPVLLSAHPWTLITYMFLHLDFFHILFNMLWLYWFGRIFLEYLNSRQLLTTYLAGGIAGGLVYILAFNIFPRFQPQLDTSLALGASASVMAIVTAISFYVPKYSIQLLLIGRVKIIWLAVALFVFDFFAIPGSNSGGHLAHIGGAFWGFSYVFFLKKGLLPSVTSPGWITNLKKIFSSKKKKTSYGYSGHTRPKTDDEYNADKKEKQKKIDAILDKIAKGGYDSLTKEEKSFLFKSSGQTGKQ